MNMSENPLGSEERDNDFNQNMADSTRLIDAGNRTDDPLTIHVGAARIAKATKGNLTPEMAKALHLDKVPTVED